MKKFALLLCAALAASMLFYGCGGDEGSASSQGGASSAASSGDSASSAQSMPQTPEEIKAHNDQIDPADIDFIQFNTPGADATTATIETSMGTIEMVLFPDEAPNAVQKFIDLAGEGFYDGKTFYEVIPTVKIAAGEANGDAAADEYSLNLWHFNGAVATGTGGVSGQADGRFYIVCGSDTISDELLDQMVEGGFPEKVTNQYLEVGGVPNYDSKDTVFGQVTEEGMEVVRQIASVSRDENNKPTEDVTITSITVSGTPAESEAA